MARIAGLQSCRLPFTVFAFREMGRNRDLNRRTWVRELLCYVSGAIFRGKRQVVRHFRIRDFRIGIFARFASPRVRQRRGRWSPPSVVPAGSRPEVAGAFTPSLEFPRRLRERLLPSPLFASLKKKKRTWPSRPSPWVRMVAPPGIEPGTRGFSVLCSTI